MCSLQTTSQVYGEFGKISFHGSLSLALWHCFVFFCQTFQLRVGVKTPICSQPLSILSQLCAIKTGERRGAGKRGSGEMKESN